MRHLTIGLCLAIISPLALAQHLHEQRNFSAEDEAVQHPVPMPAAIWALLQHDERVATNLSEEKLPPNRIPAAWFSVAQIHLSDSTQTDYMVEAQSVLRGANVINFWIFVHTSNGFKLALSVPAHDLSIRSIRFHGYKTVEASAENCCTISSAKFRFNGNEYVKFSGAMENIK